MAGCNKHGTVPSLSINSGKFLDKLIGY